MSAIPDGAQINLICGFFAIISNEKSNNIVSMIKKILFIVRYDEKIYTIILTHAWKYDDLIDEEDFDEKFEIDIKQGYHHEIPRRFEFMTFEENYCVEFNNDPNWWPIIKNTKKYTSKQIYDVIKNNKKQDELYKFLENH